MYYFSITFVYTFWREVIIVLQFFLGISVGFIAGVSFVVCMALAVVNTQNSEKSSEKEQV